MSQSKEWSELYDEAAEKASIPDPMLGPLIHFEEGADWAKPMLMELVNVLEKLSSGKFYNLQSEVDQTLTNLREKLENGGGSE